MQFIKYDIKYHFMCTNPRTRVIGYLVRRQSVNLTAVIKEENNNP